MKSETDVLIIGGGVIGVCIALYLTREGKSVTLLEKNALCAGASHGNASWVATAACQPTAAPGVIEQGLKWMLDSGSPFYIKPRANLDLLRWLWHFRQASTEEKMLAGAKITTLLNQPTIKLYKELVEEGLEFGFEQKGLLHLHLSEKYRKSGIEDMKFREKYGYKGELLGRKELEELQPNLRPEIESGIFYSEPAHIQPHKFVDAIGRQAEKEGALIREWTTVSGFDMRNGYIHAVETNQGRFEAGEVVLAAGAWSAPLAKMMGQRILLQPAKGYSITAKRPAPELGPQRPISLNDYKIAITPFGADFRFSSTLELAGFDPSINQKRIAVNYEGLNRVFEGFDHLDVKETWSGYRPLSADTLPIIGRSVVINNLIYATGHGTLGVTHAPITGKLVTQIVKGEKPDIDIKLLQPDRW